MDNLIKDLVKLDFNKFASQAIPPSNQEEISINIVKQQ
jgi:hypothetical protein